ncbi:MAG: hypothetical protein ACTSQQ_17430 [Candidatus Helarchaeota archaeon]
MDLEKLVQRIRILFGDEAPPEYITQRPFLQEDTYVTEIEERFRNKRRENLDVEDVAWLITDIIWLSEQALKYYFPKILEMAILSPLELNNFDLFPMQLADRKIIREKFGFINIAQAELILEVLHFWSRHDQVLARFPVTEELKKAIAYWKKRAK